ncbi:major facilitator superfamily domain-containing protein [Halenospora varia]|nr:major facilitator superfamily domain-containing protein [Halenospora varia]
MATQTIAQTIEAIELQPFSKNGNSGALNEQQVIQVLDSEDVRAQVEPPPEAVDARPKWNESRINTWRVLATFWAFFVIGMNDGSYGLEIYYDLTYTVVSLVFLSPFVGYTLAAVVNNLVHIKFGQRGIAIIGPACHFIPYIILAVHPPYPVLVVVFVFVGFGNGVQDAAWSAWLGNMANANQVAGFLHSFYAVGATVAPLIATAMFSKGGLPWYSYYYVMIGMSGIELILLTLAFWKQTGAVYQQENPSVNTAKSGRTREALRNPLTWIFALFIFGYMGAEVSLGGWIIVFMTKVRSASSFQSGATATGFWAGMAVGRLVLSLVTARIGERFAVVIYICVCIALELIFWLVPSLVVSAVAVALLGAFLGPLFPTAMVLITKLMPKHLHVGSVGFAAAFGGSGGAIFPFIVGAIAQAKGVKTLQPVILTLLVAIGALWLLLPRGGKQKSESSEEGQELPSSS